MNWEAALAMVTCVAGVILAMIKLHRDAIHGALPGMVSQIVGAVNHHNEEAGRRAKKSRRRMRKLERRNRREARKTRKAIKDACACTATLNGKHHPAAEESATSVAGKTVKNR